MKTPGRRLEAIAARSFVFRDDYEAPDSAR